MLGGIYPGQMYPAGIPVFSTVVTTGPIHVEGLERCGPDALHATSRIPRTTGLRAKTPTITNTEQH